MPPTVSVVTATYNYGHYLAGAIDSVRAQTYGEWELFIVDDGSTDNTADVVRPYLTDPHTVLPNRESGTASGGK